jgi:uncharacterized membrane protein YdjX (TVP38/TMEM64 family)
MKPIQDHKYLRGLFIILLVSFVSLFMLRQDTSGLLSIIQKYQNLSVVISLSLYTLLGATLIPSEPVTLFLIKLYGPFLAMAVATIGNTLAAFLEFFIGGNIGDLAEFEKRKARLPFHLGNLPVQSPLFILLVRMLPGFGSKFVSLACGIYRVPLFTYTWTTVLSNLVGAALVVAGGYGLLKLL